MRQSTAIDLFAGGPGSGCRGNKCGRPKTRAVDNFSPRQRFVEPVKQGPPPKARPSQQPKSKVQELQESMHPVLMERPTPQSELRQPVKRSEKWIQKGQKLVPRIHEPEARYERMGYTSEMKKDPADPRAKSGKKDQEQYRAKLAQLRKEGKLGYQPSEQEKTNARVLEPGDKVVLLQPQQWWSKGPRGNPKELPVGYTARVDEIFDRNGMVPGIAKLSFSKRSNLEQGMVALDEIQLLEKGKENVAPIDPSPVRPSRVVVRSQTADGADYTVVKPSSAPDDEEDMRGKFKPHGLKGQFTDVTRQIRTVADPMTRSQVFFAQIGNARPMEPMQDEFGTYMVRNPESLAGTTVFVYRHYDTGRTVIREINAGQYGHVFTQAREWTYKNHGAASGFLNKRYGIRQSLPRNIRRGK